MTREVLEMPRDADMSDTDFAGVDIDPDAANGDWDAALTELAIEEGVTAAAGQPDTDVGVDADPQQTPVPAADAISTHGSANPDEDDFYTGLATYDIWSAAAEEAEAEANVTIDTVGDYLKRIGKVPLLTEVQEVELGKAIEAGLYADTLLDESRMPVMSCMSDELEAIALEGKLARNHLWAANLRLVVSIAKRYRDTGLSLPDLIQEGNLGLYRAIEHYDYTRGNAFSTVATWWIRQGITRAIADQARTIRVPVYMVAQINELERTERELRRTLEREPTLEEIGVKMDMEPEKVSEVQEYARVEPISLHTPAGREADEELQDFIEDSDGPNPTLAAETGSLLQAIESALDVLTPREALIIKEIFGIVDGVPKTHDEIGTMLSLSGRRSGQIRKDAMAKLNRPGNKEILREFWGE